mgnify:FL=1
MLAIILDLAKRQKGRNHMSEEALDLGEDRSLLLLDDDETFLKRLAKAMEKRGFDVEMAGSVAAGKAIATARPPAPWATTSR